MVNDWANSWWGDEEIEHWKSLDHTLCTLSNWQDGKQAYEVCVSTHCHLCGKSTSSQGHLDFKTGACPTPPAERKPWPGP